MVLIVVEIGQNHNGNMKLAKKLIHKSKECGADIVKFQLFDANKLFSPDFEWYDYVNTTELSKEQVIYLKDECDKIGIEFFASVFDEERVDWLEEIGVERYKIASRSIHNKKLIDYISKTNKDMIVSLGMWNEVEFPKINTTGKVSFLYCISKYPTMIEDLNLDSVDFTMYDGFSDHTIGLESSKKAIRLGAKIIEKHFTLDKDIYGPDHKGSMIPIEMRELIEYAKRY